ncbi:phage baseplate assembly protein V [Salmonella enterica]|nr:phage baseplate assembly protein V [Salmonella enterica]
MFTAPLDQDPVEIVRLLRNLVAIGTVSEIKADNLSVRVAVGDNETDWIRWGVARAGDDVTWWTPSIGEEVVLLSPGGDLERAILLCSLYSSDVPPPSYDANQRVTTYVSGGRVIVDKTTNTADISGFDVISATANKQISATAPIITATASKEIDASAPTISATASTEIKASAPTITATATGKITATAPEITAAATVSITLDTPNVVCTGSVSVAKGFTSGTGGGGEPAVFKSPVEFNGATVTHAGVNIGNTHEHGGVENGDGATGGPQ